MTDKILTRFCSLNNCDVVPFTQTPCILNHHAHFHFPTYKFNMNSKLSPTNKLSPKYPWISSILEEDDEENHVTKRSSSPNSAILDDFQLPDLPMNSPPSPPPSYQLTIKEDPKKSSSHLPPRKGWDSQWEFFVSCISMSVGLGNLWRFPVKVYRNGGGAFLIPYFCILIFIGRPIYFLELCLGQFTSSNQVQVWRCVPLFKGIGVGSMVGALCVLTYYCAILALPVYYFLRSFENPLPWSECQESWAGTGNCNGSQLSKVNRSLPELFFKNEVLKEYENIENGVGGPDWKLTLCLIFTWVVIYFTILKGVKSLGKVAYFTAIFPYVVLLILLIRGVTLPGAWTGIKYFIQPDWKVILRPSVWYEAAIQSFFSLTTGLGSIIMFSSYNPLHYDIKRDSLIFCLVDTFTSLLAGFTTFAILGNLSLELNMSIDAVVGNGDVALAFVSYPDAIAKMGWAPQFIAAIFFLMLFFLGIGSATAIAAAISTIFCDRYSHFREWVVTLVICILGCAIGLVYVTPGGQFILQLVDFFAGAFLLFTMSLMEVIGVSWAYGIYNFIGDIEFMLGVRLGWFWKISWGVLIPFFLAFILIYSLIEERLEYNGAPFPGSAKACGWLLAVAALSCFVAGAFHAMSKVSAVSWMDKLKLALRPEYRWGPRDPSDREAYQICISKQDRRSLRQRFRDKFQT